MGSFIFKMFTTYQYSRPKKVDHIPIEEKVKSVLPASQYIMTLFCSVISRNKDPVVASFKHVYKDSCSPLTYLSLLTNLAPTLQNKQKSIFFCLDGRLRVNLAFSIIYGTVLIYVYFWSNLHFSILTSLLLISI